MQYKLIFFKIKLNSKLKKKFFKLFYIYIFEISKFINLNQQKNIKLLNNIFYILLLK